MDQISKHNWYDIFLDNFKNFLRSFDNQPGGWSARKLSTFLCLFEAFRISEKFGDSTNIVNLVIVWIVAGCFFLGLVKVDDLIELYKARFGNEQSKSDT